MNDTKRKSFKVTFASGVAITIKAHNISLAISTVTSVAALDIVAVEEIGR